MTLEEWRKLFEQHGLETVEVNDFSDGLDDFSKEIGGQFGFSGGLKTCLEAPARFRSAPQYEGVQTDLRTRRRDLRIRLFRGGEALAPAGGRASGIRDRLGETGAPHEDPSVHGRGRADVLRQLSSRQRAGQGAQEAGPRGSCSFPSTRQPAPMRPNVSYPRVFFGGISAYLEQHWSFFRKPHWPLDRLCDSRWALKLASRSSIAVNPRLLGEMTVSMLRGEEGFQRKEIRKLVAWLRGEAPPDIVTLPNSLLIGLARRFARPWAGRCAALFKGKICLSASWRSRIEPGRSS